MEFDVRVATLDDAPAIRRVARASWHAAYDGIVGEDAADAAIDSWYDVAGLRESVGREDGRFLVAERDGEVVGFGQAVVGDATDLAELARLYVHPDWWGEGIGSALLARLESWLRERGVERLRLAVLADNEVGNAFYEKRGYRRVESRDVDLLGETVADYVREKGL